MTDPRPDPAEPTAWPLTYDAPALAAALGCSVRHVRRLHAAGALPPPIRIGRLVRWPRAAVDRWMDDGGRVLRR